MNLFIGGPGHAAHDQMTKVVRSDAYLASRFREVRAFDDARVKAASDGAAAWRNYLRSCDVAVFLLPAAASGSVDPVDQKYYTQLEIEQAYSSGIPIYLLIECSGTEESNLATAVKKIYKGDLAYKPLRAPETASAVLADDIVGACRDALLESVRHWDRLAAYTGRCRADIQERIRQSGQPVDATTARAKTLGGPEDEEILEYLSDCWNFRRQCPKDPELPRHLLRGFFHILRPCASPIDVEAAITGFEIQLWDQLSSILGPDGCRIGPAATLDASPAVFRWLADWRQRALITCLRETSVAFRYGLRLAQDWAFARRAVELYGMRGPSIDPKNDILFNVAVSTVGSAAYSGNHSDLSRVDPHGSMLSALKARYERDRNAGAAKTLGDYYGTLGEVSAGRTYLLSLA